MRRLRVLSQHPHLGRPNDVVREIPGAQAYVDAGFCEWVDERDMVAAAESPQPVVVVDRAGGLVETTDRDPAREITTTVPVAPRTRVSRSRKVAPDGDVPAHPEPLR